ARGYACGKGVDCGAQSAETCAESHHIYAHNRVKAGGDKDGNEHHVKGHGLLPHAEGGAAQGEKAHENGYEIYLPALQLSYYGSNSGVDGAAVHDYRQIAAHYQNVEGHIDGVHKALYGRHQNIPYSLFVALGRAV